MSMIKNENEDKCLQVLSVSITFLNVTFLKINNATF